MMLKIGITGGIGSGKSLVCRLFSLFGIPVYNADDAARQLMTNNENLKAELEAAFGVIYDENGELNRSELGRKVFGDPIMLAKVNSIVHPYVIDHYIQWESQQDAPYIIRESAILFESGTNKGLDHVITVLAGEEDRISRIVHRDKRTVSEVKAIMSRQMPEEKKTELADYTITNDGIKAVLPQVWKLHSVFSDGRR